MTTLFIAILNMSFSASVVALAIMLVRIPLKKAPKIFSYVLWSVVLFRLICPFSFNSSFSLMPTSADVVPQDIIYTQNPAIQSGVALVDNPINTVISNILPSVNTANSINPIQPVLAIAGFIWLLGLAALLIYATIGYIRLRRRVYYATLIRDNIYETDKIKTPFVLGLIRPKIYIPTTIEAAQHDYILKHEQTHIMRRDYLIKPFAFIVLALHWFNPFVWLSYFLMSKDMEMSCDEAVLRKTDEDIRSSYSTSLLNLSTKRTGLINPLAFGESNIKSRVKNILNFKKPATWITLVSVLIVAVFCVCFISNRIAPIPTLNEINRIELQSGTTGEVITISDIDTINTLVSYFNTNNFYRGDSRSNSTGWSYNLRFYSQTENLRADITVTSSNVIGYGDYFYNSTSNVIDLDYLRTLFE